MTRGNYKGRRRPGLIQVILALVLAGCLCFTALLALVLSGARDDIREEPKVMVILGCLIHSQGQPSIMLQDRLDEALGYLEDHPDMTVVVSGGQGPEEPTSEAQAMAHYLEQNGVPRENILLEDQSHNTWQNLTYTAQRLKEAGTDVEEGIVIVSNGFHLSRARMLARRAGFENVSVLAAPSSHVPSRLKMYIREPIAMVKSFVLDR